MFIRTAIEYQYINSCSNNLISTHLLLSWQEKYPKCDWDSEHVGEALPSNSKLKLVHLYIFGNFILYQIRNLPWIKNFGQNVVFSTEQGIVTTGREVSEIENMYYGMKF